MSTFPNEILTCQLPNGRTRRLFIKYEAGHSHRSYGHRGNIGMKLKCISACSIRSKVSVPGAWACPPIPRPATPGSFSNTLQLGARERLSFHRSTRQPHALVDSARWIGQFHAAHERRVAEPSLAFLKRYDAKYYRGWRSGRSSSRAIAGSLSVVGGSPQKRR